MPPFYMTIRKAAVAGTWYPGTSDRLAAEVDLYLGDAQPTWEGDVTALIAPHAGLRYSGPVAAYAYKLLTGRQYDVVVLVGPSHYVGFEGVAICQRGAFETPLGPVSIAESWADAIARAAPVHGEGAIGWTAHYVIGIGFAALLVGLWGGEWLRQPTLWPALAVGIGTVAAPFLLMQPGMGAGIAASRTPRPGTARVQSLLNHAVFGLGLYLSARLAQLLLQAGTAT